MNPCQKRVFRLREKCTKKPSVQTPTIQILPYSYVTIIFGIRVYHIHILRIKPYNMGRPQPAVHASVHHSAVVMQHHSFSSRFVNHAAVNYRGSRNINFWLKLMQYTISARPTTPATYFVSYEYTSVDLFLANSYDDFLTIFFFFVLRQNANWSWKPCKQWNNPTVSEAGDSEINKKAWFACDLIVWHRYCHWYGPVVTNSCHIRALIVEVTHTGISEHTLNNESDRTLLIV